MLGDLAMVFDPNDEDGFLAARQSLVERFERWLGEQQPVARPRVQGQTALREVVERILAIGARLKGQTIESLLAKSDLEIGIEDLLGGRDG
jgi:hypothetical protein